MVSDKCEIKNRGWASEVSRVLSWLYLSGARVVRPTRLKELGVTTVVNVTSELPEINVDGIEVLTARVTDSQTESLKNILHEIADKLLDVKSRGGTALVHCVAGVSRSPTVILAYLIKHEGLCLREAFHRLRSVRPVIRPNTNFFQQLIDFEKSIRGVPTVTLVQIPDSNMFIPDVCENEIKMMNSRSWTDMIRARRNFHNQFT